MIRQFAGFFFVHFLFLISGHGAQIPKEIRAVSTVRHGERLRDIFDHLKINPVSASQLLELYRRSKEVGIFPGQKYRYVKSKTGYQEIKFYNFSSQRHLQFAIRGSKVDLDIKQQVLRSELVRRSGNVHGSLMKSIQALFGEDPWVAYRFMDAFAFDVKWKQDLKRGSKYFLSIEKRFDGPDFIAFGEVIEASLEVHDELISRKFLSYPDGGGVFVGSENRYGPRELFAPVHYIHISSTFQPRRLHPIRGRRRPHLGVDFELPTGEPVVAPLQGVVTKMGRNRSSGNFVVIDHQGGLSTSYAHLSFIDPNLHVGRRISIGTNLGKIGCTGYCTNPHLHFTVKKGGGHVDPLRVLFPFSYQVAQWRRQEMQSSLQKVDVGFQNNIAKFFGPLLGSLTEARETQKRE